jgi:hypothetical protein
MLAFLILFLLTLSGFIIVSFCKRGEEFTFKVAFGHIVGTVIFSYIVFLEAIFIGFSIFTAGVGLLISLLPLGLLLKRSTLQSLLGEFKEKKRTANFSDIAFYFLLMTLMYFFFERAFFQDKKGIFTGAAHNLGDLPLHLGIIYSFTDGNNFPPENLSFAGTRLTYPFMVDFVTACLAKLGSSVVEAVFWQNLFLIFSLILLLDYLVFKITNNKVAGKLSVLILFFCGGFGFIEFFRDYYKDGRGIVEFLWNLPNDYTIRSSGLRWGNSLTTLFITQRSLLMGFPLTLGILTYIWWLFSSNKEKQFERFDSQGVKTTDSIENFKYAKISAVFFGLLAGSLVLIHVHSLLVLFLVCAVLFFFSIERWKEWTLFGFSVCLVAVPQFLFLMSGSAVNTKDFIGWHFGWDKGDENFFVFWFTNLGLFIPLLLVSLFLMLKNGEFGKLIFYIPFALCFLIANVMKLAPWQWDNIKVLIYWFTGSLPFVALLLARMFEVKKLAMMFIALICLISLTFAGALDVWRTVSRQINYEVFSKDAVSIAEMIKQKTTPDALFLNAPTYNSAVVLSGRRSLIRYPAHLSSYGIDCREREEDVKKIYKGSTEADSLIDKYGIDYVMISPEEYANLSLINEDYFRKFPLIAQVGAYRVYKVR